MIADSKPAAFHPLLRTIHIFAGLNEDALEMLLPPAKEFAFAEGAIVAREGESSNRLFTIGKGQVRVCKNYGEPGEVTLAVFSAGEFFGEMCLLETLPRSATAEAIAPSVLFTHSSADFHQLYKALPEQYGILILNIARDLSRRLRHLDDVYAARR